MEVHLALTLKERRQAVEFEGVHKGQLTAKRALLLEYRERYTAYIASPLSILLHPLAMSRSLLTLCPLFSPISPFIKKDWKKEKY